MCRKSFIKKEKAKSLVWLLWSQSHLKMSLNTTMGQSYLNVNCSSCRTKKERKDYLRFPDDTALYLAPMWRLAALLLQSHTRRLFAKITRRKAKWLTDASHDVTPQGEKTTKAQTRRDHCSSRPARKQRYWERKKQNSRLCSATKTNSFSGGESGWLRVLAQSTDTQPRWHQHRGLFT